MKKALWKMFLVVQFILVPLFISCIFADPPGPPSPGGDPGGTPGGVPVGGQSASIDDGVFILIALGMIYGCYKIYEIWKKKDIGKENPV
jgi:hypothetical protein